MSLLSGLGFQQGSVAKCFYIIFSHQHGFESLDGNCLFTLRYCIYARGVVGDDCARYGETDSSGGRQLHGLVFGLIGGGWMIHPQA